jgi:hypothetical protein
MQITFYSLYPESIMHNIPEYFQDIQGKINIYADEQIVINYGKYGVNPIAILVEPRSIIPGVYSCVEKEYKQFKYVFTFDEQILNTCSNSKLLIYGQITAQYPGQKTKNISMVCSKKNMCEGHLKRQEIARKLKPIIDTYGCFDGGKWADLKDIYNHYRFNVAMENISTGYYFTEKLCNCFASKVVPIYYGSPHITEYFNPAGMFIAEDPKQIPDIVNEILKSPEEIYNSMLPAIAQNFETVEKYRRYGVWFFQNYSELLEDLCRQYNH